MGLEILPPETPGGKFRFVFVDDPEPPPERADFPCALCGAVISGWRANSDAEQGFTLCWGCENTASRRRPLGVGHRFGLPEAASTEVLAALRGARFAIFFLEHPDAR